ncbi:MAG TPA: S8 family serine peptidase [Thermoanaerobaculia bacterium]|nr:S8 family serine peptidase [Thermoanaerobaculia bacterium]
MLTAALALLLAARAGAARPLVAPAVEEALRARGSVAVLVALRPAPGGSPAAAARREGLSGALDVRRALSNADVVAGTLDARSLAALRLRPDVAAITLDGVVRPAGQAGPAQIGADRVRDAGLDGKGRAIAIVDSGVDALHPDLGGAPIPNAKVRGGWNVADGNDDVSDCSGHGTAVAGVAAGADGVAPGAGLVALKVFGAGGCSTATFSDVLAAVDWSITNAERFGIDVVNLSLADDTTHAAFCDAEDPAGAAVFAAARRAGLAVVAAAGNGGRADGLSWPACLSDVAAVGMVYSSSIGSATWGGAAGCEDAVTGADLVPCASNSGAALSLLAPGVRWQTDVPGGARLASFSGTSAAAPAAAGALLLARQARVLADPALAVDLLRVTGIAINDPKSGRTTPRVDVSAALDAEDPVSGPCRSSGAEVTCVGAASSAVGTVSSLTVALTLERTDGEELTAELTGPDGTRVRLFESAGSKGEVVRAVFGRTVDPDEPLSRLAGRDAAGAWRLSVSSPSLAPRVVSWAVALETAAPRLGDGRSPTALVPAAARIAGRFGAFFTTDVRLFNSDAFAPHDATLRFRPGPGEPERAVTVRIPPSGTRALDDVLGNAFRAAGSGPLSIDALPAVVASARTRTTSPRGGAYSIAAPALDPDLAFGAGDGPGLLLPLLGAEGWRVNVGLVETAGLPADVAVRVRDSAGGGGGVLTRSLPASGALQINDVFAILGQPTDVASRIEVQVTGGAGRVLTYATALENSTSDGEMSTPPAPVRFFTVPVHAPGADARLDLKLSSSLATPVRVKLSYAPAAGPRPASVIVPIGRHETRLLEDVLAVFGHRAEEGGALSVTALDGATVLVASRLSSTTSAGRVGAGVSPLGSGRGLAPNGRLAVPFAGGKTALTIAETAGIDTDVRLSVHAASGDLLRVASLAIGAGGSASYDDLFAELGLDAPEDGTIVVENLSGGFLAVQALRRDPLTGDALAVSGVPIP